MTVNLASAWPGILSLWAPDVVPLPAGFPGGGKVRMPPLPDYPARGMTEQTVPETLEMIRDHLLRWGWTRYANWDRGTGFCLRGAYAYAASWRDGWPELGDAPPVYGILLSAQGRAVAAALARAICHSWPELLQVRAQGGDDWSFIVAWNDRIARSREEVLYFIDLARRLAHEDEEADLAVLTRELEAIPA